MKNKGLTHTEHVSIPILNKKGDMPIGEMGICDITVEFLEPDKKYFKIVLKFPNGSFRQLFVNEGALIGSGGGRDTKYWEEV